MSSVSLLLINKYLAKAKKATKTNNIALAMQYYKAILQNNPNHPLAKKNLHRLQKILPQKHAEFAMLNPSQEKIIYIQQLINSEKSEEANNLCQKLVQIYPLSAIVFDLLSFTLRELKEFDEALLNSNQAIKLNPNLPEAYLNRSAIYAKLHQEKEAIKNYEKAIQLEPTFINDKDYKSLFREYIKNLMQLGKKNTATRLLNKMHQENPNDIDIQYLINHYIKEKNTKIDEVKLLKDQINNQNLDTKERIKIYFSLGALYEKKEQYDESFFYLKKANDLEAITEKNYSIIDKHRNLFSQIKHYFIKHNSHFVNKLKENSPIQHLFILGMPRSGTTLTEQIISSHPKVHGAGELSQINQTCSQYLTRYSNNLEKYLDHNQESRTKHINLPTQSLQIHSQFYKKHIVNLRHDYLKKLASLKIHEKIITSKLPQNHLWIGFILSAFPQAKIIQLKRDPMAICWSLYKHHFNTSTYDYTFQFNSLAEYYHLYSNLMSFWHQQFPNRIYELNYNSLTLHQEKETRKLLDYCELEWSDQCLHFYKHERAVRTASMEQVRKKMYKNSSEAWKKYEKHLNPLLKLLQNNRQQIPLCNNEIIE